MTLILTATIITLAVAAYLYRALRATPTADAPAKEGTEQARGHRLFPILALALSLSALALYLVIGSPDLADREEPNTSMENAARLLTQAVERNPSVDSHLLLANTLALMGNHSAAARHFKAAVDLGDTTAATQASFGEALTKANDDTVTLDALAAFKAALKQDPENLSARVYIGLANEQIGNFKKAIAIWKSISPASPMPAGTEDLVPQLIAEAADRGDLNPDDVAPASLSDMVAPTAHANHPHATAEGAPAQSSNELPEWAADPAQRSDMIKSMVSGLADRLTREPTDVQGWLKLIRAFRVLGDTVKAEAALADAMKANPGNRDILAAKASPAPSAPMAKPNDALHSSRTPGAKSSPEAVKAKVKGLSTVLERELEADPNNVAKRIKLAQAYFMLRENTKAIEAGRQAVALAPQNIDAILTLAQMIYTAAGANAEFVNLMRTVFGIDPDNLYALYYLADAERLAGRKEEARKHWTKLLTIIPADDPDRREVEDNIKSLGLD